MIDLTRRPILVSASMPLASVMQYALMPFLEVWTLIITGLGLVVWAVFAAQVFFRANRCLQPPIKSTFVYVGLGSWPLMAVAAVVSFTLDDQAMAEVFEAVSLVLWFGSIASLTGTAAVALERAEKGGVRAVAVAGTSLQIFLQMFCAVHVCARLERLDKSVIWWK